MTDLEMTKLCAEAVGLKPYKLSPAGVVQISSEHSIYVEDERAPFSAGYSNYDPLHDDAQAMALVKKLFLSCTVWDWEDGEPREWLVTCKGNMPTMTKSADLNRAIVECVAKMQLAKASPAPKS